MSADLNDDDDGDQEIIEIEPGFPSPGSSRSEGSDGSSSGRSMPIHSSTAAYYLFMNFDTTAGVSLPDVGVWPRDDTLVDLVTGAAGCSVDWSFEGNHYRVPVSFASGSACDARSCNDRKVLFDIEEQTQQNQQE